MTEQAKLIQSMYEAFAKGDVQFIVDHVSDDCEWNGPDAMVIPYHGVHRGKAGVAQFFLKVAAAVAVSSFDPELLLSEGDEVMTTGSWAGSGVGTGRMFRAKWAMRFTVKNGKVTYFRPYEDTAIVAAALG